MYNGKEIDSQMTYNRIGAKKCSSGSPKRNAKVADSYAAIQRVLISNKSSRAYSNGSNSNNNSRSSFSNSRSYNNSR